MRCLYHNIPDWTNQYKMQQKSYNILSQNHNAEQAKTLNVVSLNFGLLVPAFQYPCFKFFKLNCLRLFACEYIGIFVIQLDLCGQSVRRQLAF